LSQLRVRKAKELLAWPDRTLKEVARSVGFQDELYFSRVFKKSEGVSPAL
jgi:YesN/AraC family two-component response regulator